MSIVQHDGWGFFLANGESDVGMILVHPIYGLDDYIKSVAAKLAAAGFSVAAVDLFRGKTAVNLQEGMKLREAVTRAELVSAFESGVSLLRDHGGANMKVGSMGFCMGGGFALQGACDLGLNFCVDFYGMIANVEDVKGIKGPVLLILGGDDERITPWASQTFLPSAVKNKKRVDVHLYPNAGHAFHTPGWEGYNPEAAEDAWKKTLLFLSQFR
jgi:carboxymethylenebutenolidase